jgi:hemolysin III
MTDPLERATFGRMQNPVRGFLHGSAAIASIVGAVVLCARASHLTSQIALLVFAVSLVGLYTVSSLYHSVPWRNGWKERMQRVDHSMIYVLVAGTYTPIACIVLDGWPRYYALGAAWDIALVGIVQKIFWPRVGEWFSISLATGQGWLALPMFLPLAQRLPFPALLLTALGGVLYTVGMVFLVTERPRLWPRVFSYHELFHVCVVTASSLHWAMMFAYVAPLGEIEVPPELDPLRSAI